MIMKKRKISLVASILAIAMMAGCAATPTTSDTSTSDNSGSTPSTSLMKNGTYESVGAGFGGDLKLNVVIESDEITAINILEHKETAGISDPAITNLPTAIIAAQSTEVDVVAGATMSSNAIISAVNTALDQAKGVVVETVAIMTDADVMVVGGGQAGLRATIAAAEKGAKVLLVEKTGVLGGTVGGSTQSGANMKMQHDNGIMDDTAEKFFADFIRLNENYQQLNPDVVYDWNQDLGMYYAENSGAQVEWLDALGADLGDGVPGQPTLYMPLNTPRVLTGGSRVSYHEAMVKEMQQYIDAGTVQVVLRSTATELLMDGTAVVGAKVMDESGKVIDVKADTVILATGGYGHSEELVTRFNLQNFTTTSPESITGDGFIMAEQAGAVLKNMDFITTYAGGLKTPEDGLKKRLSIRIKDFPHIVFINEAGERFVDELGNEDGSDYDEITSWWKKGDNRVFIMVDEAMVADLKANNQSIISGDKEWKEFDDQLAKGNVLWSGSTIEEVAEKAGINGENLSKTIERYNGFAQTGVDEDFGRTRFMTEFTGENYYIFETTPYLMITAGGPEMNDKGEVLNKDGQAIPGLYQAGEIVGMGNAFGRTTVGGVGNTGCLVWGELAGNSAADYALAK